MTLMFTPTRAIPDPPAQFVTEGERLVGEALDLLWRFDRLVGDVDRHLAVVEAGRPDAPDEDADEAWFEHWSERCRNGLLFHLLQCFEGKVVRLTGSHGTEMHRSWNWAELYRLAGSPTMRNDTDGGVPVEELRARRVVVVGADGFERVVIDANEHNGGVTVYSKEGDCNAQINATEECWGGDANVIVAGSSEVLAMMTVNKRGEGHEGKVWVLPPNGRGGASLTHDGLEVEEDEPERSRPSEARAWWENGDQEE